MCIFVRAPPFDADLRELLFILAVVVLLGAVVVLLGVVVVLLGAVVVLLGVVVVLLELEDDEDILHRL